jgi:hypothetical protein
MRKAETTFERQSSSGAADVSSGSISVDGDSRSFRFPPDPAVRQGLREWQLRVHEQKFKLRHYR